MIIISRCPYRISLLGGGSDLDWFVKENDYGICLGYSLSKYTYTVINQLSSRAKRGILNYSSREEYSKIEDIAHPLIKSALEELNFNDLVEISPFGFAARGSGLGGSSSFLLATSKVVLFCSNSFIREDMRFSLSCFSFIISATINLKSFWKSPASFSKCIPVGTSTPFLCALVIVSLLFF